MGGMGALKRKAPNQLRAEGVPEAFPVPLRQQGPVCIRLPAWGVSKGTCYLFSLPPAAAGAPVNPCLHFLSGLLSISTDSGGQEPWSVTLGRGHAVTLARTAGKIMSCLVHMPRNWVFLFVCLFVFYHECNKELRKDLK